MIAKNPPLVKVSKLSFLQKFLNSLHADLPYAHITLAVLLFELGLPGMANAADDIDTIIVTSDGRDQEIQDTSIAISRLSADLIEATNAIRIGDILSSAPGTFLSGLNGPREIVQIRQPLAFDNRTLFLEDGVPLQSSIFFDQSALAYSIALASPGSIEVLRGPGTALYGSDAFAGIVHARSKPAPDELSGLVRARFGQFGLFDLVGDIGAPISDTQKVRVTVAFSGEEGFRDETEFNRAQIIANHELELQAFSAHSSFTFTRYETEAATSIPFDDFLEGSRASGLSPLVDPEAAEELGIYARAQTRLSFELSDKIRLEATPYYRRQDIASTATFQPATVPRTEALVETFGALPRLYWDHNEKANTVFGVDLESTDFSRFTFQNAPDTVVFGSLFRQGVQFDYDVDFLGVSPYLQHSHTIGPFTANLGLRYDRLRYDFENALEEIPGDARLQVADRVDRFDAFSPKAGLIWNINTNHNLFARYARGFRVPRESDLYELEEGQAEFTLEPEIIDSGEIGWRFFADESAAFDFFLELVGYWSVSRDGVITDVQTAAGNISINAGSSQFRGIELAGKADLGNGFFIDGNFSFQDFRFLQRSADGPDPFDGNLISEAPRTLGQIALTWTPPSYSQLTLSGRLRHIGRWALNDANTLFTDNEFILSAFLNWEFKPGFSINLRAENITDTLYPVFADAPSFAPNGRARPGGPQSFSGGLKFKF